MTKKYEQKAKTKEIHATSRVSLKIGDTFYTLEYSESRLIPDIEDINIDIEKQLLWKDVNNEVDNQAEELTKSLQ